MRKPLSVPARLQLDSALSRIAHTAPEYGPGNFSNHAPMVVEAMTEMGRVDAVERWLEKYLPRLSLQDDTEREQEPTGASIDPPDERLLGHPGSYALWQAWIAERLNGPKASAFAERWVERLAPGAACALGHGLLRTAHAMRAWSNHQSDATRWELSCGLAYWASRYRPLEVGTHAKPSAHPWQGVANALSSIPRQTQSDPTASLQSTLASCCAQPAFAPPPLGELGQGNSLGTVADLVTSLAQVYSANIHAEQPGAKPIEDLAFVHAITCASAVRLLSPHVRPATTAALLDAVWVFCAGTYSAFSQVAVEDLPSEQDPSPEPGVGEVGGRIGELVDEAIAAGDEHGIKFTEVCIREVRAGAPRYLLVLSRLVVARLFVQGRARA